MPNSRDRTAGCDTVPPASVTSPTPRQTRELWEINVMGTQHVMQAALRAATCLSEDTQAHWAVSPQDWRFSRVPQRRGAVADA